MANGSDNFATDRLALDWATQTGQSSGSVSGGVWNAADIFNKCGHRRTAETYTGDHSAQAKVVDAAADREFSVRVRCQSGAQSYYAAGMETFDVGAETHYRIWKMVAGTATSLALHASQDPVTNDVVRLEAEGTTLTLFVNDVQILQTSDASLSGGAPGLGAYSATNPKAQWDDFAAADISAAPTTTARKRLQLEDGSGVLLLEYTRLLLEDGTSLLLLENASGGVLFEQRIEGPVLLLEDGRQIMLEDGSGLLEGEGVPSSSDALLAVAVVVDGDADGAAAGSSTVSGVGAAFAQADASSSGIAAPSIVGAALWNAAVTAAGASTPSGVTAAIWATVAAASGAAVPTGSSATVAAATASAAGGSTVAADGEDGNTAAGGDGSAAGVAAVLAVSGATAGVVASAAGTSTPSAAGAPILARNGSAAGTAAASASTTVIVAATASSAGASVVNGVSGARAGVVGSAAGSSTATAESPALTPAFIEAAGILIAPPLIVGQADLVAEPAELEAEGVVGISGSARLIPAAVRFEALGSIEFAGAGHVDARSARMSGYGHVAIPGEWIIEVEADEREHCVTVVHA